MEPKKVLIIEDEVKLARFIELELNYEGYSVCVAHDGKAGLDMYLSGEYDLVVLDLMLPGLNGLEVLRRIRRQSETPVIMLTAKGEVMDKVVGLDSGADDYITKPFAIEELLARMRVALRKGTHEESVLKLKNLTINVKERLVRVDGVTVELTKTEYELLLYLVRNKNIALTREQILNQVWGYDYIGETNVVDVYVRYLRTKLDDAFDTKFIHTLRGVGYIAKNDEQ